MILDMKVAPSDGPPVEIQIKKTGFFKKYFMEGNHCSVSLCQVVGQALHEGIQVELPPDADFIHKIWFKYRKYLGILLPEGVALVS